MTRIQKLRAAFGGDFSAALVCTPYNMQYLCDFASTDGALLVTKSQAVLLVDSRYYEAAKAGAQDVEVELLENRYKQLAKLLASEGITRLHIENELTLAQFSRLSRALDGVETDAQSGLCDRIRELRMIKDAREIERIKAAQRITDGAFSHILGFIKPGVSEREVAAELEYHMRRNGADGVAFETICVSGANSSLPHGVPTDKKIESGDFVTMDFGAKKDGYCSDMTRTVAVGFVSDEQRRVYDTVLQAQSAGLAALAEGARCDDVDRAARDIIDRAGYEGCFGHGLGHSLGLEIHEYPRLSKSCAEVLREGMITTVEPGIYLEGRFGVRIEDMAVIASGKILDITASERQLIVL